MRLGFRVYGLGVIWAQTGSCIHALGPDHLLSGHLDT